MPVNKDYRKYVDLFESTACTSSYEMITGIEAVVDAVRKEFTRSADQIVTMDPDEYNKLLNVLNFHQSQPGGNTVAKIALDLIAVWESRHISAIELLMGKDDTIEKLNEQLKKTTDQLDNEISMSRDLCVNGKQLNELLEVEYNLNQLQKDEVKRLKATMRGYVIELNGKDVSIGLLQSGLRNMIDIVDPAPYAKDDWYIEVVAMATTYTDYLWKHTNDSRTKLLDESFRVHPPGPDFNAVPPAVHYDKPIVEDDDSSWLSKLVKRFKLFGGKS